MCMQGTEPCKIVLESKDAMYVKLLAVDNGNWLDPVRQKLLCKAGEEMAVDDVIRLVSGAVAELVYRVHSDVQMMTWMLIPEIFRSIVTNNDDLQKIADRMLEYKNASS